MNGGKNKPERRVLHIQHAFVLDRYITYESEDAAREVLAGIAHGNPFVRFPRGPQATRLRSFSAALLPRVPAGWKPDKEEP